MQVNMKKIISYGILLMIGMTLTVYGLIDITVSRYAPEPMSDAEVIERAKELGMVDIKEQWIKSQQESDDKPNSNTEETPE